MFAINAVKPQIEEFLKRTLTWKVDSKGLIHGPESACSGEEKVFSLRDPLKAFCSCSTLSPLETQKQLVGAHLLRSETFNYPNVDYENDFDTAYAFWVANFKMKDFFNSLLLFPLTEDLKTAAQNMLAALEIDEKLFLNPRLPSPSKVFLWRSDAFTLDYCSKLTFFLTANGVNSTGAFLAPPQLLENEFMPNVECLNLDTVPPVEVMEIIITLFDEGLSAEHSYQAALNLL